MIKHEFRAYSPTGMGVASAHALFVVTSHTKTVVMPNTDLQKQW